MIKINKILLPLLILLFICNTWCFFLSGQKLNRSQVTIDNIIYVKTTHSAFEEDIEDGFAVIGVSKNCPKELYIPPIVNGKKVLRLGASYSGGFSNRNKVLLNSFSNVDKIYIPFTCSFADSYSLVDSENVASKIEVKEQFMININFDIVLDVAPERSRMMLWIDSVKNSPETKLYVASIAFDRLCEEIQTHNRKIIIFKNFHMIQMGLEEVSKTIQIANTTYLFNYEGSPNEDVFFINNFERGGLIEDVPYKPTREGYEFGGWYKEPECINKWDFDLDTLPAPEYDSDGELIFKETKLYAKWI